MPRTTLRYALVTGGVAAALLVPLAPYAGADTTPPPDPGTSATPTATIGPSPALAEPTQLTLARSTGTVSYGVPLGLTGTLTRADGSPVSGAVVGVWSRTLGQAGRYKVAEASTDSNGRMSSRIVPRTSAEYTLRYAGSAADLPATSNPVSAAVQPRLAGRFLPAGIALKQTAVLRGALAPAYAGAHVTVRRRSANGSYTDIAILPTAADGSYQWSVTPGLVGGYTFRVVLPPQPAHLGAATAALTLQVDPRDLRSGDRGGDVASLQRRLAAQKADVGRIDGVFGYDLLHAVIGFQKSQGLPRTGFYDRATSARLAAPAAVRLRVPSAGRAVEIDLAKQVLYVSQGGVLQRIVDISSGTNQLYEQDGVTYRAFTPIGHFAIARKIDDPNHKSPLGTLYRPAFFFQGWAIHGSNSVPVYPASHGCIRVTDPAQDRLWPLLTLGTPVTVYAR